MDFINQKFEQIEKPSQLAVLFNGAFYVVDIVTRELVFNPSKSWYTDFEVMPNKDFIFLSTDWGIQVFQNKEFIKEIRPDSIDGIRFYKIQGDILTGEIADIEQNGENWIPFDLNIPNLTLYWNGFEIK